MVTDVSPHPINRLQVLADQCVQCGLCLPVCPTYALEPIETESPRGRIALIRAWDRGIQPPSPAGETHLDQCLGCRSCEAACPAHVQYGALLTLARSQQRTRRVPNLRQRLIETGITRPELLKILLVGYRHAFPLLPRRMRPLPRPPKQSPHPTRAMPPISSATQLAVFTGCIARGYDTQLYTALERLCHATGASLSFPTGQTCCGALHAHAGDTASAAALASRNRAVFAEGTTVLSLASGCHDAIDTALHGRAEVIDAIAWLAQRAQTVSFQARRERIALHLPCTQRNVVKSDADTRALLARVPELDVVVLDAAPHSTTPALKGMGCCGAAGSQMLIDPVRAAAFRQPLLDQFVASGATRLLSANIGCRLHLANGTSLPVQHPLEFLAECLA